MLTITFLLHALDFFVLSGLILIMLCIILVSLNFIHKKIISVFVNISIKDILPSKKYLFLLPIFLFYAYHFSGFNN